MANTLCILFVASLFVLNNADSVPLGRVKGYIYKTAGQTAGAMNHQLGLAVKDAKMKSTTDEQKICIDQLKGELFKEGNAIIGLTANRLNNMADSHSADIPNATISDMTQAIDSVFDKILKEWLPEKMVELNKC